MYSVRFGCLLALLALNWSSRVDAFTTPARFPATVAQRNLNSRYPQQVGQHNAGPVNHMTMQDVQDGGKVRLRKALDATGRGTVLL